MYLVHYNATTGKIVGYLDTSQGVFVEDDGTSYFSVSSEVHEQYSNADAWTDGKVITNKAPPNKFAELTVNGWVVNQQAQDLALNQAKTDAKQEIDDAVASIYMRFGRFQTEYDMRLKQALEFKANGYKGDVPSQILALSEPAGITAKKATDTILRQAAGLRGLLDELGKLRMQKIAVSNMATIDDIDDHTNTVLSQINEIAGQL